MVDESFPFIGEEPLVPGHELYPFALTRAQIQQYSAAHPDQKAAIYNPRTVECSDASLLEVRGTPVKLTGGFITLAAYDKNLSEPWRHAEHREEDYSGRYEIAVGGGLGDVTIDADLAERRAVERVHSGPAAPDGEADSTAT